MNRLKDYFEQPEEVPAADNYFEVRCHRWTYTVDKETAQRLIPQLERTLRPRWLRFTDQFGSAIRVRTDTVIAVAESTIGQRQAERDFDRARRLEEKTDRRPWEEDD